MSNKYIITKEIYNKLKEDNKILDIRLTTKKNKNDYIICYYLSQKDVDTYNTKNMIKKKIMQKQELSQWLKNKNVEILKNYIVSEIIYFYENEQQIKLSEYTEIDNDYKKIHSGNRYYCEIIGTNKYNIKSNIEEYFRTELKKHKIMNYEFFNQENKNLLSFENNSKKKINFNYQEFIFVVEGKNDTNKLKRIFPNILTFETNGLGIDQKKIKDLKNIQTKYKKKILIITDPDIPGEIIRNRIAKELSEVNHLYLNKNKSKTSKKVGLEHVTDDYLIELLKTANIKTQKEKNNNPYVIEDLIRIGIYANKKKREEFCLKNNIAYGNNKKVLKQINNYGINI